MINFIIPSVVISIITLFVVKMYSKYKKEEKFAKFNYIKMLIFANFIGFVSIKMYNMVADSTDIIPQTGHMSGGSNRYVMDIGESCISGSAPF
jgi:hypothetical protein